MSQILFENCTLLDTTAAQLLPDHHVLVEGDRIVEVSDRPISASDAVSVDVGGRTLMPGLIDAHVHATITTMSLEAMARKPGGASKKGSRKAPPPKPRPAAASRPGTRNWQTRHWPVVVIPPVS